MLAWQQQAFPRRRRNLPLKAGLLLAVGLLGCLAVAAAGRPGPGSAVASVDAAGRRLEAEAGDKVPPSLLWALFNMFAMCYMFVALYVVCDELFVPSLSAISCALKLSPDVAGATFMAAGGSSPEFFTSLISAFSPTPGEVGISAIVGSAIFNVLFTIGICGLVAQGPLQLTGYPLGRDSSFYFVDLVCLVVFFGFVSPGQVELWEAAVLVLNYVLYCVYMVFSRRIENALNLRRDKARFTKLDTDGDGRLSKEEAEKDATLAKEFAAADQNNDGFVTEEEFEWHLKSQRNIAQGGDSTEPEHNTPLSVCPPAGAGVWAMIWYIFTLPLVLVLICTVPDCRRQGCWKYTYVLGFFLSIFWIAIFSYIVIESTEVVGAFTHIPANILAITLLAWGTSIPDCLNSILVTWQGHGDMAVSSSIGSNIFDVTVGLPVPIIIRILIKGGTFPVGSEGIVVSIGLLVLMLVFAIGTIMCNGWVLNRCLGSIMCVLFAVIQVWSVINLVVH